MNRVFYHDSPREQYTCDAAIVWCFDARFEPCFRNYLKQNGVMYPDPIKVAGGAKCLASPGQESERNFVLDQIRASMRLHGTKRVILMVHSDCGAYGGLKGFNSDVQAEAEHHRQELHHAAASLNAAIPGLTIEAYFVDFEGVWKADLKDSGTPVTSIRTAHAARSPTV